MGIFSRLTGATPTASIEAQYAPQVLGDVAQVIQLDLLLRPVVLLVKETEQGKSFSLMDSISLTLV